MVHEFDPGYGHEPFATLVGDYPGEEAYPLNRFRTEWGPIFHRGRLDGSAVVVVVGQDPAQHEAIVRRILVGEAGQRVQGALARLGITRRYVMVNTFLYSVVGAGGSKADVTKPAIAGYRNRWLDALVAGSPVQAVVTLGLRARQAWELWAGGHPDHGLAVAHLTHPTAPESAGGGREAKAAAMRRLCANWNRELSSLHERLTARDVEVAWQPYGEALTAADLAPIPEADLPAGLPGWMRAVDAWASRTGTTTQLKRSTIVVKIPRRFQPPA
ncbi:MAG: uracil-DNA glycosylase [Actinomycetota bacterium]|nr:uracil-DNA glycosylase [Actinomycetota bacterium]